jgi:GxxExxY protein
MPNLNKITSVIIDVAIQIHRTLGPGLLESVYQSIMAHELRKRGLLVSLEVPIPVLWDGLKQDVGFRADLIVEGGVVVEIKSLDAVHPVHRKILLTYLRVSNRRVGLLINFGEELLKNGIFRVVNQFREEPSTESPQT